MKFSNIESFLLKLINSKMILSELDEIKLVHGLRILITDIKKLMFIYCIALTLGCLFEMILTHASFFAFRQVAYGIHSKSFLTCLITSSIIFPFSTYLIKLSEINQISIWLVYTYCTILLILIAPIGTSINRIKGTAHVRYLKKKIYIRLLLLGILVLFSPIYISKFLILGLLIEAFTVLISFYKKERLKNAKSNRKFINLVGKY